jgi:hypothetical protein
MTSSILVFAISGVMHEWLVYTGYKHDRADVKDAYYNPSKRNEESPKSKLTAIASDERN